MQKRDTKFDTIWFMNFQMGPGVARCYKCRACGTEAQILAGRSPVPEAAPEQREVTDTQEAL